MSKRYTSNGRTKPHDYEVTALDLILEGIDPAEAAKMISDSQAKSERLSNRERMQAAVDNILANIILPTLSAKLCDILDQILKEAMQTDVEGESDD